MTYEIILIAFMTIYGALMIYTMSSLFLYIKKATLKKVVIDVTAISLAISVLLIPLLASEMTAPKQNYASCVKINEMLPRSLMTKQQAKEFCHDKYKSSTK